ncbi:sulfotransferase family protein [Pseudodonghicola flavimaris]|uniref:Sulfotransferase n=1 Tax=Pseudodonghicola flavimaris TaxID=3050036 RepID=A0ABT7F1W3_9RHOB|nr:sulfotransferase [Pseudodonghicola flavimaris]MDK3018586.1 sulfotransferase [Pseudodonghicola flavimaris]
MTGMSEEGPPPAAATASAAAEFRPIAELRGKTMLLCIGAMKAATSWLFAQLQATEGVAVSPLKEVHFFDARFPDGALMDADAFAMARLAFHMRQPGDAAANLRRRPAFRASLDRARMIYDPNAYFEHFAGLIRADTRVLADITPAYACIGAAGFRHMRDACATQGLTPRVLFILRDPVDRLWSHLRFLPQLRAATDPLLDWPELIRDPVTLRRSDYRQTLLDLEQAFGPEQITCLFYEQLFPHGYRRLCATLGVAPQSVDVETRYNRADLDAALPGPARQAFRTLLQPQYDFCAARFGAALPAEWRAQAQDGAAT